MNTTKLLRWPAGVASVAVVTLALACERANSPSEPSALGITAFSAHASGDGGGRAVRWDIISLDFSTSPIPNAPGGSASAKAEDGSKITLTGSGTFEPGDDDDASGGGTWETFNAAGTRTGGGTYRVAGLVRFDVAPGSLPSVFNDRLGSAADARAGLAILKVRYSDRSKGFLAVSCHLAGTTDDVFEGVTASKGFVTYWNRVAPAAGVDGNRTLFHVLERRGDDDDDHDER